MVLTFTFLSCCARFMLLLSLFLYLPSFLPLLSHLLSLIDMTGQRCSFTWALSARGCKVSRERGDKQEILYYDFLIAHIFFFFPIFCVCVCCCVSKRKDFGSNSNTTRYNMAVAIVSSNFLVVGMIASCAKLSLSP